MDACALIADPARTARAQLLRGRARLARARYDDAAQDFAAVQAVARAAGDAELEGVALESLAWCSYYARDIERAAALAERALRHPASGTGARVLAGRLRHTRGDLAGAVAMLEPVSDDDPDPAVRAAALSYLGSALAAPRPLRRRHRRPRRCRRSLPPERPAATDVQRPVLRRHGTRQPRRSERRARRGAAPGRRGRALRPRRVPLRAPPTCCRGCGASSARPERAVELAQAALDATQPVRRLRRGRAGRARPAAAGGVGPAPRRRGRGGPPARRADGRRAGRRRLRLAGGAPPPRAGDAARAGRARTSCWPRPPGTGRPSTGHWPWPTSVASTRRSREASDTGSDLLVARVAAEPVASRAAERIAARLDPEHRAGFLERGEWRAWRARASRR